MPAIPAKLIAGISGEEGNDHDAMHVASMTWKVRSARREDLSELSRLFNDYRCFYGQPSDLALAEAFLHRRFDEQDSTIFVAAAERLLGFCQIFRSLSSVRAAPIIILNDLYVAADARGAGIGQALLDAAVAEAKIRRVSRLTLETGVDNDAGQALYEKNGWTRNQPMLSYSLAIDPTP